MSSRVRSSVTISGIMAIAAALSLFSLVSLAGCSGSSSEKEAVARVGERSLTWADLNATLPESLGQEEREIALHRVKEWVNREALAQEARRLRLDTLSEMRRRIAQFEQLLLSEQLRHNFFDASENRNSSERESLFQQYVEEVKLRTPIAIYPENIPLP